MTCCTAGTRMSGSMSAAISRKGTTTTPFDMVVQNKMSRLHLCMDVLRYVPDKLQEAGALLDRCTTLLSEHERYICAHFDDLPEIKNWVWSE